MDMFPNIVATNNSEVMPQTAEHLEELEKKIQHCFLNISAEKWLKNPFMKQNQTNSILVSHN